MTDHDPVLLLRATALDAIVAALREQVGVDRCTLRLDVAGEYFPVVHESRTRTPNLIADRKLSLQGQPVVEAILSGRRSGGAAGRPMASEDPAFQAMLATTAGWARRS